MKIAMLILAHDEPELLGRLVARLQHEQVQVFIHIDEKKDIEIFKNLVPADTVFIKERISINHGGFTLTRAMISFLKAAFAHGDYDIFQTLSGRDYPLKDIQDIVSFYTSNKETDFIHHYRLTKGAEFSQNIYQYHFVDYMAGLPQKLRPFAVRAKHVLNRILKHRKFLEGLTPYRGSQWFALSRRSVEKILSFLETRKGREYFRHFRFSWGSDEIFFQTLVLHFKAVRIENYLHHVDWDKRRENPAVLDEQDYPKLMASAGLYARKLQSAKSARLLEMLDGNRIA